MADARLHLELTADRLLARRGGGSTRHFRVRVVAAPQSGVAATPPVTLNLGIALDISGSMDRPDKLPKAKEAAAAIVRGLGEADTLSMVTFGDAAHVVMDAVRMDAAGRARALSAIDGLETDGMTALSEGWLTAAQCLAPNLGAGRASRVILLSDGDANRGIKDVAELCHHASNLAAGGITTTTVGIGDDYVAALMQGIAEHGGGQMHDAEHGHEILEVLAGELADLRALAAESVRIRVVSPEGLRTDMVTSMPGVSEGRTRTVEMGSLGSGRSRDAILKVTFPAGAAGTAHAFEAIVEGTSPGGAPLAPARAVLTFTLAPSAEVVASTRDPDVARTVLAQRHARIVRKVVAYNREGRRDDAKAYLGQRLPSFAWYAEGIAGGEEKVAELRDMLAAIDRRWDERTRKNLDVSSYKTARSEADYRTSVRGDLTRTL